MSKKFTQFLYVFTFLLPILLSSCSIAGTQGNGDVITEERQTASFHKVKASMGLDVYLKQGTTEEVMVKADENIIDKIVTKVEDGQLRIYLDGNIRRANKMEVHVTVRDITYIKVSSGADLISEGEIVADRIRIKASSGADVKMTIDAQEIDCDVSSGADISLSGWAKDLYIEASSGSDVNAQKLKTENCTVKSSSGADVSVYSTSSIEVKASSSSDVTYAGNPPHTRLKSSSGAEIDRR